MQKHFKKDFRALNIYIELNWKENIDPLFDLILIENLLIGLKFRWSFNIKNHVQTNFWPLKTD